MEYLDEVIAAYKKMDQRARDKNRVRMKMDAELYPMKKAVKLRLVASNPRKDNARR